MRQSSRPSTRRWRRLVDPQTRAAQAKALKAIEAKARSFVPRYRALEEGEANGVYTIRLEAEVDELALGAKSKGDDRRAADGTPAKMGVPGTLVAAADKSEASAAFVSGLVTALSSAGVRARAGDPGERAPVPPPRPRRAPRWSRRRW